MRISNIAMLIAALVCATAAALLARAWLKDQAGGGRVATAVQQQQAPMPATRFIVVAARDLKSGDKLNPEMLRLTPWSGDTVPKGAFLSVEPLVKAGQERTVLASVSENEPVLEQKLSGSGLSALAAKLADSMNAVTIRVNDVAGVAGFVQPDDRVDVFMTTGGRAADGPAMTAEKPSVVVLLQNVRVLAIDQAAERKGQASPPKAVTLEVNTEDAQKLVLAGTIGQLSLALRRFNGAAESETRPIAMDDLVAKISGQPTKTGQVIGVTRAAERQEYTVQPEPSKLRRSEAAR
jgi:pilus assembly protein CpaB